MTDAQKAEYFDEWNEYFEPLARIRREVNKAKDRYAEFDDVKFMVMTDSEVGPEIDNLIRTILEEGDE